MVNWGGFEGHHKVGFAETATLLSGASGTGKSTLLDAYVALMMDSNTPFNGASNDNVIGRARGSEQRSVLSYVRGKIDTSRESGTGALSDVVLRGDSTSTWSAVAMTWRNHLDERFTALRVYYAPVGATSYSDVASHMATIGRCFDLRELEEFAADRFPRPRLKARFPGLSVHDSYGTFATTLYTRLGIGARGDGAKALKLLARIQGGRQVTTVDGLYKTMVLEQPGTYASADRAIAHFDDLEASYETMKNAEAQVRVLEGIPDLHKDLTEAKQNLALLGTFGLQSADRHTPFDLWRCRLEANLLDSEILRNRAQRHEAAQRAAKARAEAATVEDQIGHVQKQQRDHGGDALDAAEHAVKQLQQERADVHAARVRFDQRIEVLDRRIDTQTDFDALRADSERFLATVEAARQRLEDDDDKLGRAVWPLQARSDELRRERDSLKGREGLVPQDLHDARLGVAHAISVQPEELPFVAELIDMAPAFESWREAAELALGGFAVTMLVDERRLGTVRRKINPLKLGRRLRFEGVELNQRQVRQPELDRLPGRFVTKDTPFTPWVMNTLLAKFDYTCVDSPADLDHTRFGLTITGQTRERRRGAHGGHGARRVIGFSNKSRLEEIAAELETIEGQLEELQKQRKRVKDRQKLLDNQRDAHRYVADTAWSSIDVAAVDAQIQEQKLIIQRLLGASDVLAALKQEEQELKEHLSGWQRGMYLAEDEQKTLDGSHKQLVTHQNTVNDRLQRMQSDHSLSLSNQQQERLDAEYAQVDPEPTLDTYQRCIPLLHKRLREQETQARKDATTTARRLQERFERFQEHWPRPNLGVDPVDSYEGFQAILDELLNSGLHERRAKFSRSVNDWSGQDLLRLHGAFQESIEEIETRLEPVNDILSRLPFGAGRDRLHITLRRTEGKDIAQFRKELKFLASGSTSLRSDEQVEARFLRLRKFMDRLRGTQGTSERDYLIDVRRHVYIEAERRDPSGHQLGVYTSLGGKSGGETQELVAFIVGAALRYQLGDADLDRPRYAPVFLDEGFIKSDSQFAGRAVSAWRGLGFQLIVGVPNDKVTAIEPFVDLLLQVTKNSKHHSHVSTIVPTTPAPGFAPAS